MRYISSAAIKRTELLTKAIVENIGIAYHFCSFTDPQTQDIQIILGSILIQLCQTSPTSWDSIEELYLAAKRRSHHEPKKPDVKTLEEMVSLATMNTAMTYMFIDAVNEAQQTTVVLDSITRISQKSPSLRVMMSSTKDISQTILPIPVTTIVIEQERIVDDIHDFIVARIDRDEGLRDLPRLIKAEISSRLQNLAYGKYRTHFLSPRIGL